MRNLLAALLLVGCGAPATSEPTPDRVELSVSLVEARNGGPWQMQPGDTLVLISDESQPTRPPHTIRNMPNVSAFSECYEPITFVRYDGEDVRLSMPPAAAESIRNALAADVKITAVACGKSARPSFNDHSWRSGGVITG